jgi:hypothetical protein
MLEAEVRRQFTERDNTDTLSWAAPVFAAHPPTSTALQTSDRRLMRSRDVHQEKDGGELTMGIMTRTDRRKLMRNCYD